MQPPANKTVPDSLLACEWPPVCPAPAGATQADAAACLTETYLKGDACADDVERLARLLRK